jgi:hypothetical protein
LIIAPERLPFSMYNSSSWSNSSTVGSLPIGHARPIRHMNAPRVISASTRPALAFWAPATGFSRITTGCSSIIATSIFSTRWLFRRSPPPRLSRRSPSPPR